MFTFISYNISYSNYFFISGLLNLQFKKTTSINAFDIRVLAPESNGNSGVLRSENFIVNF